MPSQGAMPGLPPLLKDRVFRRYWSGATVSLLGDRISGLALPLAAILSLHAGAAQMGELTAAGLLPALAFSLPIGIWVDRSRSKRHLMIASDILRALLIGCIPLLFVLGHLAFAELYGVALLVGTLSLTFQLAQNSLFPAFVTKDRYVDANALLQGSRAVSYLAGPSLGGFLVQLLSAPIAVLFDAFSYVVSALTLLGIAPQEPPPAPRTHQGASVGVRFLWHSPVLRPMLLALATVNLFNYVFSALFLLYASQGLHIGAALIGLISGIGAMGAITGALVAGRLSRRIGVGRTLLFGTALFPAPLLLVPLAGGPRLLVLALLLAAELGSGFGVMLLDISFGALWTAHLPDEIRARVNGAFSFVNNGIRPIGALLGGALPALIGVHGTLWLGAVGALLGCLWLLPSPVPSLKSVEVQAQPAGIEA